jgi:hypothetical protein
MPGFSGLSPVQPAPVQYVLPAGGAYVDIPATIFARSVKIAEDGALAAYAGFLLKFSNGVVVGYAPDQQPARIGDESMNRIGAGNFLGMPAQTGASARPADLYCQASSAAGTTINVWEYE